MQCLGYSEKRHQDQRYCQFNFLRKEDAIAKCEEVRCDGIHWFKNKNEISE